MPYQLRSQEPTYEVVNPMDARFLAFLLVAAVLIMTPGPDMALVTRNALRGGSAAVSPTAFGVALGLALWGTASAVGLAALLAASAFAFLAVKLVGAAYLTVLGAHTLIDGLRGHRPAQAPTDATSSRTPNHAFWQGLANNLLNPKAAVIFLSVFPQFIHPGDPGVRLFVMVALFSLITLGWLHLYGTAVAKAGEHFGPSIRRAFDSVAGTVMIGLGIRLALERR